jgi:hypothetical protein
MIFERRDTPTIMDGLVVRYKDGPLEISASRRGVCISCDYGLMLTSHEFPDEIHKYLRRAHAQYKHFQIGNTPWTEAQLDEMFAEAS